MKKYQNVLEQFKAFWYFFCKKLKKYLTVQLLYGLS